MHVGVLLLEKWALYRTTMDPREGSSFEIHVNSIIVVIVVYQRAPSQYASIPQQQPPQGESSLFQGTTAAFMPSGTAGMMNDPMASAALQYSSHLAQSGGQLMQQNVSLARNINDLLIQSLHVD